MLALLLLLLQAGEHEQALAAYKQHQYPEAVAHFTEALKTEKPGTFEYEESVLLLGQTLFLQSNYKEAIPWLEKATASKAATPESAYMLGNACIFTQQPDRAVKAFAQLFKVAPDSAAAHLTTARMMLRHDVDGEAARQAKRALEIDPRMPEAHFLLGEVAILHAEIDLAIAELTQEIAINPGYAMAHYRLGDAYSRREQWDEAMAPLERSVWLNPNYSGPFILLGKGYLKRKELFNAEGVLRHALRLDPQNQSAHYLLGQTLMQEGKTRGGQERDGEVERAEGRELSPSLRQNDVIRPARLLIVEAEHAHCRGRCVRRLELRIEDLRDLVARASMCARVGTSDAFAEAAAKCGAERLQLRAIHRRFVSAGCELGGELGGKTGRGGRSTVDLRIGKIQIRALQVAPVSVDLHLRSVEFLPHAFANVGQQLRGCVSGRAVHRFLLNEPCEAGRA